MTFAYIVRCRFTAPEKEDAWNAWYSGPKIVQMLAQPYFRTCQRFRRASGNGRDYVALWIVSSPEALRTRQYNSQWGFAEWEPLVTDWSRDLFDGGDTPESAFAVPSDGALRMISFDGTSDEEAQRTSKAVTGTNIIWMAIAGLDRHTPLAGLQVLPRVVDASPAAPGVQDAVYRPISPLYTAP